MCGICGVYSTNFSTPEREIFQGLLLLNVWRGRDSTGVIRINDPKDEQLPLISSRRSIMASPGFISTKGGHELIFDPDKKAKLPYGMIGHTRAATKGDIKLANAHPFTFDNVVGVHNGTIKWAFDKSKDFETDSEALYANINDYGIEKALNNIANSDPAYALAFVDKRENTLNFIRNDDRPLYFTYMYNRTTLIWSSQKEMIEFVLARRNVSNGNSGWDNKKTGAAGYFTLNANNLMQIEIGKSPDTAVITPLEVKKVTRTYVQGNYHAGEYSQDYQTYVNQTAKNKGGSQGSKSSGTFREEYTPEELSGLDWLTRPDPKDSESEGTETKGTSGTKQIAPPKSTSLLSQPHRGEPVSQSERNFRLSQGCFCCGVPVNPTDMVAVSAIQWWNREHFACGACYGNLTGETAWVKSAIDDDWPTQEMLQIAVLN